MVNTVSPRSFEPGAFKGMRTGSVAIFRFNDFRRIVLHLRGSGLKPWEEINPGNSPKEKARHRLGLCLISLSSGLSEAERRIH